MFKTLQVISFQEGFKVWSFEQHQIQTGLFQWTLSRNRKPELSSAVCNNEANTALAAGKRAQTTTLQNVSLISAELVKIFRGKLFFSHKLSIRINSENVNTPTGVGVGVDSRPMPLRLPVF